MILLEVQCCFFYSSHRPREEVEDMMKVFDSDGDGAVDFREFWKALVTTWFPLVSGTHRPKRTS